MIEVLSKFVENLKELLEDEGTGIAAFAEKIGVSEWTVYSYLRGNAPETAILVRIADYFGCTTDFLLGFEPEGRHADPKPLPPFSARLRTLIEARGVSKYRLCKEIPVTHSVLYHWLDGTFSPSLNYCLLLMRYFDCSLDFLLGREE